MHYSNILCRPNSFLLSTTHYLDSTAILFTTNMSTPYKFQGWLGLDPSSVEGKMQWKEYEPKTWEETDVDIKVTHCGICGSDLHTLRSGWAPTLYPCCVG